MPQIERPKAAPNGAATVELLKVLLRMTSERHGVAAKVIATVDDLDRIAADDEADVPALKGWRRELFGERALDLKHGRLALAIERGRVVAVRTRLVSEQAFKQPATVAAPDHRDTPLSAALESGTSYSRLGPTIDDPARPV